MNTNEPSNDNGLTYGEALARLQEMRMSIYNDKGPQTFARRRSAQEQLRQIKALEERIFRICSGVQP